MVGALQLHPLARYFAGVLTHVFDRPSLETAIKQWQLEIAAYSPGSEGNAPSGVTIQLVATITSRPWFRDLLPAHKRELIVALGARFMGYAPTRKQWIRFQRQWEAAAETDAKLRRLNWLREDGYFTA